jgi:hypothetical protein
MRVLPRVVVALLIAGMAAGCSKFDAALGQQQMQVTFKDGTSNAERLKIRAACASLPNVKTTPVANLKKEPYALSVITYQVNNASNADIARLSECLSKFTAVAGVSVSDSSDNGS